MSVSFLTAFAKVKENTKELMETATAQLSSKLQMSLNSSSVPCTSVSTFRNNGYVPVNTKKADLTVPQVELAKTTANIASRSSSVQSPVKYMDPGIISATSKINVKQSESRIL